MTTALRYPHRLYGVSTRTRRWLDEAGAPAGDSDATGLTNVAIGINSLQAKDATSLLMPSIPSSILSDLRSSFSTVQLLITGTMLSTFKGRWLHQGDETGGQKPAWQTQFILHHLCCRTAPSSTVLDR
eukprot:2538885-Pleurochrysis_carterae.AAC.2